MSFLKRVYLQKCNLRTKNISVARNAIRRVWQAFFLFTFRQFSVEWISQFIFVFCGISTWLDLLSNEASIASIEYFSAEKLKILKAMKCK